MPRRFLRLQWQLLLYLRLLSGAEGEGDLLRVSKLPRMPPENLPAIKNDPYKVLGLPPTANREAIKKQYRDLAKQCHPDLNPDSKVAAQERMKAITAAHEMLTDDARRKAYDSQPVFAWRKPKDLGQVDFSAKRSKTPPKKPGFLESLMAFFSTPTPPGQKKGDMNEFRQHLTAALTCAEFPGGKLLEQAEGDFLRALECNSEHLEATFDLGLVYYKLGRFDDAHKYFKRAQNIAPNDASTRRMLELLQPLDPA